MKPLQIELYNNKWLYDGTAGAIHTASPHVDQLSTAIDHAALKPHPIISYPTTRDLHQSTSTSPRDHYLADIVRIPGPTAPA